MTERAPAKLNACLFLGATRADGRHELVSVMQSLEWGDELRIEPAAADEVVCPGVEGPNLAAAALAAVRQRSGWQASVRVTINKRIPLAAGLGGGSADAAAVLRMAGAAAGLHERELLELAAELGSDVPAQLRPGRALATGAGERVEPLAPPPRFGVLVLASRERLATAAVYREADRLGLARAPGDLAARRDEVRAGEGEGPFGLAEELLVNDLEPAARRLCPSIDADLALAREAGARHALVSGSGPTVVGLFEREADARAAAQRLAGREPAPVATAPLRSGS